MPFRLQTGRPKALHVLAAVHAGDDPAERSRLDTYVQHKISPASMRRGSPGRHAHARMLPTPLAGTWRAFSLPREDVAAE